MTVDSSGGIDVMTASWVSVVSKTPPTIALSLHHGRQSYANLQQSGVFTVNVIPSTQARGLARSGGTLLSIFLFL